MYFGVGFRTIPVALLATIVWLLAAGLQRSVRCAGRNAEGYLWELNRPSLTRQNMSRILPR